MSVDPFVGVWIGLAGSVAAIFAVAWVIGLFERPHKKPPPVAAE